MTDALKAAREALEEIRHSMFMTTITGADIRAEINKASDSVNTALAALAQHEAEQGDSGMPADREFLQKMLSSAYQKGCKDTHASLKAMDELRAEQTDRHQLQSQGKHPAPCARFCEATAFQIEIRQLKGRLDQQPDMLRRAIETTIALIGSGYNATGKDIDAIIADVLAKDAT